MILALGATLCRKGGVGLDPFTSLNQSVADRLGLSLGVYQLGFNIFIILFVIALKRDLIGWGTIVNMVGAGFFIDLFSNLYSQVFHFEASFLNSAFHLVVGILLFTLGTSLYMSVELGVAPYDAIAPILSERLHWKYRFCRIGQDVFFTVAAFTAKGPVGVATIINAFFTGPLIIFWNKKVSEPLIKRLTQI